MAPINPKYWQDRHRRKRVEQPVLYMWRRAKYRAKRKGVEFTITMGDITIPEVCPVFGIKLDAYSIGLTDNSPTLDRIRPSLGYVPGNIEVISWFANRLKGESTPEQLQRMAEYYGNKTGNKASKKNSKSLKERIP